MLLFSRTALFKIQTLHTWLCVNVKVISGSTTAPGFELACESMDVTGWMKSPPGSAVLRPCRGLVLVLFRGASHCFCCRRGNVSPLKTGVNQSALQNALTGRNFQKHHERLVKDNLYFRWPFKVFPCLFHFIYLHVTPATLLSVC